MQASNAVQRLPSLEPVQELGVGPFGSLWLARLASGFDAGRFVFLRRTPLDAGNSDEAERALAAFHRYRSLSHPSLVKSLEMIRTASELVWIEEQIVGVTLAKLQELVLDTRRPVPVPIAARIVLDILQASGALRRACSEQGLEAPALQIFPDLVIVANYGEPLLAGIGTADALYRSPALLRSPGLTELLAPANVRGATGESRDIATAGSILWSLLLIRDLFEGITFQQTLQLALHFEPSAEFASRVALCVPEPIQQIVRQATAPTGRPRFRSAQEMVNAFGALPTSMLSSSAQVRTWLEGVVGDVFADLHRHSGVQELRRNSGAHVWSSKSMTHPVPFPATRNGMRATCSSTPCPFDDEPTIGHPSVLRASARSRSATGALPPIPRLPPPLDKSDFDDEAPTIQRPVRPSTLPVAEAPAPSQPTLPRRRSFSLVLMSGVLLALAIAVGTGYLWYRASYPTSYSPKAPRSTLERPLREQKPIEVPVATNPTARETASSAPSATDEASSDTGVSTVGKAERPARESKPKSETPKAPRRVSPKPNRDAIDRRWGI